MTLIPRPKCPIQSFPDISDEALQVGFRKATEFRNLLILASVVLAIVSLLFGLDFLLGSLLGSAIVGLNFHWTVRFVLNMLEERKLQSLYLIDLRCEVHCLDDGSLRGDRPIGHQCNWDNARPLQHFVGCYRLRTHPATKIL